MLNEIRSLISLILLEDKYKEMTGQRYADDIKKFSKFVSNTSKEAFENGYYVHFTDTPKIGINPSSPYLKGYYFYPLTKTILNEFIGNVSVGTRGQARGARYVYLVKITPDNILESDKIYPSILKRLKILIDPIEQKLLDTTAARWNEGTAALESKLGISLNSQIKSLVSDLRQEADDLKRKKSISIEGYENAIREVLNKHGAREIENNFFMLGREEKTIVKVRNKVEKTIKSIEDQIAMKKSPVIGNSILSKVIADKYYSTGDLLSTAMSLKGMFSSGREYSLDYERAEVKKILHALESDLKAYVAKDGTPISGREIGGEAIKEFYDQTGIDGKSKIDSVGYFIKIAIGNEYEGVFDAGHAGGLGDAGGENTAMGLISNQEKTQLYLKPQARNKIQVISIIDRFEGEKEWSDQKKKEKEFGHHTPDVSTTDPGAGSHQRVKTLRPRLKTPAGEPRERYKSIAASNRDEEK